MFLAADWTRLQDLDEAVRHYLAWESILADKESLNLSPHQVRQAEQQKASADSTVAARLPETYQWLLVPTQTHPQANVEWQTIRLTGNDTLAVRASKRLKNDELLVTALAGTRLRMELDRVPLWRDNHVAITQLVEDFARYPYLPRLKNPAVLICAVRDGVSLITWEGESFAYADSFDQGTGRYRGLRAGQQVPISDTELPGLLVKPEAARLQLDAEQRAAVQPDGVGAATDAGTQRAPEHHTRLVAEAPPRPTRFHGSVPLDPTRVGRDASRIAEEVIAHLAGLPGAQVRVTLEIESTFPGGVPKNVERIVTENSRTLKFTRHGFERE